MWRLLEWIALSTTWLLLIYNTDVVNIIAGAIIAALVIALMKRSLPLLNVRFEAPSGWPSVFIRLPAMIVHDSLQVIWLLMLRIFTGKATMGNVISRPFDPGDYGPADAARSALSIFAISTTPNTLAIAFSGNSIVIHQLGQSPEVRNAQWPV